MDSVSTVRDLAHVAELLMANDRYLLVPHVQPDPDAFGSTCGLALLLKAMGKTVYLFCDEKVPENCRFLNDYFPISDQLPPDAHEWKLVFLDGGERNRQIATVRDWPTWMNLDHHMDNGQYAEWIYSDVEAAATSLIVADLAEHLPVKLDAAAASCLFVGVLFDTRGAFITDRCDGPLFRTVARLVDAGARPDVLNRLLNEQLSMADFRLYGAALARLQTSSDGRIVYTALTQAMIAEAGGGDQAMELLTQHLPKIAGGEIYVLFKEAEPGKIKLSLRSKGRIAVNELAKQFNGGGHKFASGARFEGDVEAAIAAVVPACEAALKHQLGALA